MEVLALIIARGGSKSIPHKNIKPLAGYPLIAYSIAAARSSAMVERVIVSTDDEEIAAISRRYGAETPFMRPSELAQDDTPDLPVFQHALQWLAEVEGYEPGVVLHLRPTSPFRRLWHIEQAISSLIEHPHADSVRSVCEPFQNPFKMWTIGEDGFMQPLISALPYDPPKAYQPNGRVELYNLPRQVLPQVYWQTGYVDAAWSDTLLEKNSMTGDRILPLVIPPSEWVDIDSPQDWQRAEYLLESGELTFADLGFEIREFF